MLVIEDEDLQNEIHQIINSFHGLKKLLKKMNKILFNENNNNLIQSSLIKIIQYNNLKWISNFRNC